MATPEIVLNWNSNVPAPQGYNIYRGTLPGNEGAIPYNGAMLITVPSPSSLSSVAASVSGSAVYTGTVAGGAGNARAGFLYDVSGFADANNNGRFACTASTATSLTLSNAAATAASGTPASVVTQVPQFTDTNVFPGKVYSYEVTAVSGGVESADSIGLLSAPVPFPFSPNGPFLPFGLDNFEILAGSTITNSGATTVAGDIGVYPGTSITGFPPGILSGVIHTADFVAAAGQASATTLYNELASATSNATISGDIGGQTFTPGVYTSSSTVGITGTLTLDAAANPNAVWIFQVGSALTTAVSNSQVVLLNGAQASNVYWQVGSSATLGGDTSFAGTIVAQASISCGTSAQINGRLLALTGAVTLLDNSIVLFNAEPFTVYASGTVYSLGIVIFDCASGMFEQVITAGTTGATRPTFSSVPGTITTDGTVQWLGISPTGVTVNIPLPPSPPNVAPAPPSAPTGLVISLET